MLSTFERSLLFFDTIGYFEVSNNRSIEVDRHLLADIVETTHRLVTFSFWRRWADTDDVVRVTFAHDFLLDAIAGFEPFLLEFDVVERWHWRLSEGCRGARVELARRMLLFFFFWLSRLLIRDRDLFSRILSLALMTRVESRRRTFSFLRAKR